MDPETLKGIYRRWLLEVWGEGRHDVADELLHVDLVDHHRYEGQPDGRAGDMWAAQMVRRAFPDLRFEPDLIMSDGEYVAGRWTMTGTNTGTFDLFGLPPTGRPVTMTTRDVPRPRWPVRRGLAPGGRARHARATRPATTTSADAASCPVQRVALSAQPRITRRLADG